MVCICAGITFAILLSSLVYLLKRQFVIIRMVGLSLKELFFNCFKTRRMFEGKTDINGKIVAITGANTGIGKVTALEMAKRGANVIIGCRDIDKGNKAIEDIKNQYPNANIRVIKLDLSSLESVRQFAKRVSDEEKQIDILINNAGVMMCPKWKTEDGFEMQFGTNYLGHFLLTMQLLDRIKAAPKARIVIVSSLLHKVGTINFDDINMDKDYSPSISYWQSKLANVLFAKELARKLSTTNVTAYSLHPGIIKTDLQRHFRDFNKSLIETIINRTFLIVQEYCARIFLISPEKGAQTTLYCAIDESVENESGYYYDNCKRVDNMTSNVTDESAKKLWDLSCDLVGLEDRLRII